MHSSKQASKPARLAPGKWKRNPTKIGKKSLKRFAPSQLCLWELISLLQPRMQWLNQFCMSRLGILILGRLLCSSRTVLSRFTALNSIFFEASKLWTWSWSRVLQKECTYLTVSCSLLKGDEHCYCMFFLLQLFGRVLLAASYCIILCWLNSNKPEMACYFNVDSSCARLKVLWCRLTFAAQNVPLNNTTSTWEKPQMERRSEVHRACLQ